VQAARRGADKSEGMRGRLSRLAISLVVAGFLAVVPSFATASDSVRVGSDVSGAPFEFYASGGHQMLGFDIDLLQLMAAKLGRPIVVDNHQFDQLLAAVRSGQFDLAMSAISDTPTREKLVDFVDYFLAGGGIMVPAGNPHRIFSIDALCGYSVSVESGTSYEADIQKQSKDCVAVGLAPIQVVSVSTDDAAFQAFSTGRASAYVTDYPVGEYRVRTTGGGKQFEMAGAQLLVVPYGIAVAKTNVELRTAIAKALVAVIASGGYDVLLKKWNLPQGALRSVPINAGILFSK
jgi:polar amino acid transport system substrate-binding protein